MSRFYASISGSAKTQATRQGTAQSGIEGHIRGWNAGIRVVGKVGADEEEDQFWVYATGGSNGGDNEKYLGVLRDGKFTPAVGLDYQPMRGLLDV